jgi:hypothetical protein
MVKLINTKSNSTHFIVIAKLPPFLLKSINASVRRKRFSTGAIDEVNGNYRENVRFTFQRLR